MYISIRTDYTSLTSHVLPFTLYSGLCEHTFVILFIIVVMLLDKVTPIFVKQDSPENILKLKCIFYFWK